MDEKDQRNEVISERKSHCDDSNAHMGLSSKKNL